MVGRDVVVVDAQPFGQPVEQGQDQGDHTEHERDAPEHETDEQQECADRGEDRGERRPRHVDP